jgi:hypothetical protein
MCEVSSEFRWLLDRVAEFTVPVRLVLPETVDQVAQWNVPCPRWRSLDVFAAFRELENVGLIRFLIYGADENEIPVTQPKFNHQALSISFKEGKRRLLYRLTDAGGRAWEHVAAPNWTLRVCL